MTIIAPSVLSADFYDLKSQIEELNKSDAEWIHYDVMDGHFVPNLSFGPDILDIHTPKEMMYVDSVERTWNFIVEVLGQLV